MKRSLKISLLSLLLVTVLLFAACSGGGDTSESSSGTSQSSQSTVTSSAPEPDPVYSPYTGLKGFDESLFTQRPMSVMVHNIRNANPQHGLGSADIVYEAVTEGGITRVMAIYPDYEQLPRVGPVRSAREYYLDLAAPLNTLYVHFGGSTTAKEKISQYSIDTIDGNSVGYNAFFVDEELSAQRGGREHATYTDADLIQIGIDMRSVDVNMPEGTEVTPVFNFTQDGATLTGGSAESVDVVFSGYLTATFSYEDGVYKRYQFEGPHIDLNTNEQLAVDNVFVLLTDEGSTSIGHTVFDMTGGTGYYFSKGEYEKITWTKGEYADAIVLTDSAGNELEVNPGKSWVCIVGDHLESSLNITPAETDASSDTE